MTLYTASGELPQHKYVWVDKSFITRDETGFMPAVWFGITSDYGKMWGCHLLLKNGALYRTLPPHALAFRPDPEPIWTPADAQAWDCYGMQFSTIAYKYFGHMDCVTNKGHKGTYLFTAIPIGDGFTAHPGQSKEFKFIELRNGRLTIKSTDMVLFDDKSFTEMEWPKNFKRQSETYHCESME